MSLPTGIWTGAPVLVWYRQPEGNWESVTVKGIEALQDPPGAFVVVGEAPDGSLVRSPITWPPIVWTRGAAVWEMDPGHHLLIKEAK